MQSFNKKLSSSEGECVPLMHKQSTGRNSVISKMVSIHAMDEVVTYCTHFHDDEPFDDVSHGTVYDASFVHELSEELGEKPDPKTPTMIFHQALLLLGTTIGYALAPITIDWAMTVGQDQAGQPIKGMPFLPATIVCGSRIIGGSLLFVAVLINDISLKMVFKPSNILPWLPIGAGYAAADLFEILACSNNKIDPATYIVLSQGRLMASAVAMRLVMGAKQTAMQWTIILCSLMVVIAWEWVPADVYSSFAWDKTEISSAWVAGIGCTLIKMALSVILGILCQRQFQNNAEVPFLVQMLRIEFVSGVMAIALVPVNMWWIDWKHGFFGGKPENGAATGWGIKAIVLVAFYVYFELVPALCVKRINVLAKSFCTAASCIITYVISVVSRGIVPNPLKVLLSLILVLNISQYGASKFEQAKQSMKTISPGKSKV